MNTATGPAINPQQILAAGQTIMSVAEVVQLRRAAFNNGVVVGVLGAVIVYKLLQTRKTL